MWSVIINDRCTATAVHIYKSKYTKEQIYLDDIFRNVSVYDGIPIETKGILDVRADGNSLDLGCSDAPSSFTHLLPILRDDKRFHALVDEPGAHTILFVLPYTDIQRDILDVVDHNNIKIISSGGAHIFILKNTRLTCMQIFRSRDDIACGLRISNRSDVDENNLLEKLDELNGWYLKRFITDFII